MTQISRVVASGYPHQVTQHRSLFGLVHNWGAYLNGSDEPLTETILDFAREGQPGVRTWCGND
jgi:hypothetical protein